MFLVHRRRDQAVCVVTLEIRLSKLPAYPTTVKPRPVHRRTMATISCRCGHVTLTSCSEAPLVPLRVHASIAPPPPPPPTPPRRLPPPGGGTARRGRVPGARAFSPKIRAGRRRRSLLLPAMLRARVLREPPRRLGRHLGGGSPVLAPRRRGGRGPAPVGRGLAVVVAGAPRVVPRVQAHPEAGRGPELHHAAHVAAPVSGGPEVSPAPVTRARELTASHVHAYVCEKRGRPLVRTGPEHPEPHAKRRTMHHR